MNVTARLNTILIDVLIHHKLQINGVFCSFRDVAPSGKKSGTCFQKIYLLKKVSDLQRHSPKSYSHFIGILQEKKKQTPNPDILR